MVLAERCVLLSAEILKSQSKYSEAAALLIGLTSEVKTLGSFFSSLALWLLTQAFLGYILTLVLWYFLAKDSKGAGIKQEENYLHCKWKQTGTLSSNDLLDFFKCPQFAFVIFGFTINLFDICLALVWQTEFKILWVKSVSVACQSHNRY